MAKNTVPNQQITTYTRNGFRCDVNKVQMLHGIGIPLQPIYNTLLAPVLDSGDGSICSPAVFNASGQPLNPHPEAPGTLATGKADQELFLGTFPEIKVGAAAPLSQVALNFMSAQLNLEFKLTGGSAKTTLTVTGQTAPGVVVSEDLEYESSGGGKKENKTTKYAYISLTSVIIKTVGTGLTAITEPTGKVTTPTNSTAVNLLNPFEQTGLKQDDKLDLSAYAADFPPQKFWINLKSSGNVGTVTLTVTGDNESNNPVNVIFSNLNGIQAVQVDKNFTSVRSIVVKSIQTPANGSLTASIAIQDTDVSVMYRNINGQNMSQMDCQRCVVIALKNTGSSAKTSACNVLITGYDDRLVQVQETLSIPVPDTALPKDATNYYTSNKAYSFIQSVIFDETPGTKIEIAVSASNQFFGLPFYLCTSVSGGMEVTAVTANDDIFSNEISARIQGGNNFYATQPNANRSVSLNTYNGSTSFSVSNLDARGIIALQSPIVSNNFLISGAYYVYAADSYVNALLQNSSNPLSQQQASNLITGTQGALINNPKTWTKTTWATTALTPFDLTGCQFPGDQGEYNVLFNNSNLPENARRQPMGIALTAPSAT